MSAVKHVNAQEFSTFKHLFSKPFSQCLLFMVKLAVTWPEMAENENGQKQQMLVDWLFKKLYLPILLRIAIEEIVT